MQESHPDQKYIEGLLSNDHKLLKEIYARFSAKVVSFVQRNNGTTDEAKDIIQEILMVIYQQARNKNLVLTCPFDAYFFLLCKRKWLSKLRSKKGVTTDIELAYIYDNTMQQALETEQYESQHALLEAKFKELGDKCQELLRLSFTASSLEEVAAKLNVTYGYVRKKKSLCMGRLTELVQNSPEYKKMKNEQ